MYKFLTIFLLYTFMFVKKDIRHQKMHDFDHDVRFLGAVGVFGNNYTNISSARFYPMSFNKKEKGLKDR